MPDYTYAIPRDSDLQAILNKANYLAPDINGYYNQIQGAGDQALRQYFGAAQQNIGAQFSPMMRMAQARLGGQPLLADSGYANRLNRELQQNAFGQLSNAYSTAAANQAQQNQSALERLIQARIGSQQNILSSILSTGQKKKGFGDYLGTMIGAPLGAFAGGFGSGYGSSLGAGGAAAGSGAAGVVA